MSQFDGNPIIGIPQAEAMAVGAAKEIWGELQRSADDQVRHPKAVVLDEERQALIMTVITASLSLNSAGPWSTTKPLAVSGVLGTVSRLIAPLSRGEMPSEYKLEQALSVISETTTNEFLEDRYLTTDRRSMVADALILLSQSVESVKKNDTDGAQSSFRHGAELLARAFAP